MKQQAQPLLSGILLSTDTYLWRIYSDMVRTNFPPGTVLANRVKLTGGET